MNRPAHLIVKDMEKMKADLIKTVIERGLYPPTVTGDFYLWWIKGRNYLFIEIRDGYLEVSRGFAGQEKEDIHLEGVTDIRYATTLINEFYGWPV